MTTTEMKTRTSSAAAPSELSMSDVLSTSLPTRCTLPSPPPRAISAASSSRTGVAGCTHARSEMTPVTLTSTPMSREIATSTLEFYTLIVLLPSHESENENENENDDDDDEMLTSSSSSSSSYGSPSPSLPLFLSLSSSLVSMCVFFLVREKSII